MHSKEDLQGLKFAELRAIASEFGVCLSDVPANKRIERILAAQKKAERLRAKPEKTMPINVKLPAKMSFRPAVKAAPAAAAPAKAAAPKAPAQVLKAAPKAKEDSVDRQAAFDHLAGSINLALETLTAVGVRLSDIEKKLAEAKKTHAVDMGEIKDALGTTQGLAQAIWERFERADAENAEAEEEEEDTEAVEADPEVDAVEEEEEEVVAPKPKAKRGRKAKAAPEPEPEDEEEEDVAAASDNDTVTLADIEAGDEAYLKAVAAEVNKREPGRIKLKGKDLEALRKQLAEYCEAQGQEEEEAAGEDDDAEGEETTAEAGEDDGDVTVVPEWLEEGVSCEVNVGEDTWIAGTVEKIEEDGILVSMVYNGKEGTGKFTSLDEIRQPAPPAAGKKAKKAA